LLLLLCSNAWEVEKSVQSANKLRQLVRPCVALARLSEDMAFAYSDFSLAVVRQRVAELTNLQASHECR
jgi:hypothetical protein